AILDQHVRLCKVADLPIERQHHAALEQDAALLLQAVELAIGCGLRPRCFRHHFSRRSARSKGGAYPKENATPTFQRRRWTATPTVRLRRCGRCRRAVALLSHCRSSFIIAVSGPPLPAAPGPWVWP